MTTLTDIFDAALLAAHIEAGYVRPQQHPSLPLTIYNYTEKTQYEHVWDVVTLTCRGLISDRVTGAVLARPLPKFFNHDQPGAPVLPLGTSVRVTDKADGSLGIIYPTADGLAVATRGSFASDQARHATEILRERYAGWAPPEGLTVLVEIVYPANRIVLDYGDLDDLILLGAVEIATGRTWGPEAIGDWPGPVVETLDYTTYAEAIASPPRAGKEGLVVWAPETDQRLKIKYADYVALHRIVTGLNARVVWSHLVDHGTVAGLIEALPDEFHSWVRDVESSLREEVATRVGEVETAYAEITASLPDGFERKDFALVAAAHPLRGSLFSRLDGRDLAPHLWQQARPGADWTPSGRTFTEEDS